MIKSFIFWLFGVIVYLGMLGTTPIVNFIIPIFTRAQYKENRKYNWGWLYGTFDNPPQGDDGFVTKRAPFPNVTTGLKGYWNRVAWMRRNRLYNLKKKLSVQYGIATNVTIKGNPDISDKYKIPGWMFAIAKDGKKVFAFEFYGIFPWSETRNLRVRLGWKIKGRKFTVPGDFAQLVFTINPFDGYGNETKKSDD